MAKGVGSLSGRADATLVGAATRASLAAVPKDLSGVHQRTAAAYASMAQTTGAVYGKALEVIGQIGGQLIENAKIKKLEPESEWSDNQMKDFEIKPPPPPKPADIKAPETDSPIVEVDEDSASGEEYTVFLPGDVEIGAASEKPNYVYTYADNDGNEEPITVQTTAQKLEGLREELKNVKNLGLDRKGRKAEKNRIRNVMDRIRQENVTFGAFQETMTTMLAQDQVNFEASGIYGMSKMLFSRALLAGGKPVKETDPNLAAYNGARAIQGYDKNGRMVFTYVDKYGVPFKNEDGSDMTIDKSAIASGDLFIAKSEKRPIIDGLINTQFIQQNYKAGFQDFENLINKGVDENITDKNTFLDIAHYHSSNTTGSLASVLNNVEYDGDGVPQIKETEMSGLLVGALQGLGNKNQFDVSGDGVFDEKDYATQENYAMLVKKVLSGDDLQLGKSLLKAHYKNATNAQIEKFKSLEPAPVTDALTVDQKRYYDVINARNRTALDNAKFLSQQKVKEEEKVDTQNTVYSIESEFSAGQSTIGKGSRYVQKTESTPETVVDGETIPAQEAGWTFYKDGKVVKTMLTSEADILDEITKHVTDTSGKYESFTIGETKVVKTGTPVRNTTYEYKGNGKWELKN